MNRWAMCLARRSSISAGMMLEVKCLESEELTVIAKPVVHLFVDQNWNVVVLWSVGIIFGKIHVDTAVTRFGYHVFVVFQRLLHHQSSSAEPKVNAPLIPALPRSGHPQLQR